MKLSQITDESRFVTDSTGEVHCLWAYARDGRVLKAAPACRSGKPPAGFVSTGETTCEVCLSIRVDQLPIILE